MSQVTRIEPVQDVRRSQQNSIAWEVAWQHSISLGDPDYTAICDDPDVSAENIEHVLVGIDPDKTQIVGYLHRTAGNPVISEDDYNNLSAEEQANYDATIEIDSKETFEEIYRQADD